MEDIKQKLREEFIEMCDVSARSGTELTQRSVEQIADFWLSKLDTYADAKIAKMFDQEANRNRGMIKMRGKNGVTFIPKDEYEAGGSGAGGLI